MSTNARALMPGSSSLCSTRLTRCARSTDANCPVCPWVNSRRNCPSVAGAYTPPNNPAMPPERITCRSSMLSAPAAIPAMIDVTSNERFSGWTKTFTDRRLCAAIADWLTFNGHIPKPAPTPTGSPALEERGPAAPHRQHEAKRLMSCHPTASPTPHCCGGSTPPDARHRARTTGAGSGRIVAARGVPVAAVLRRGRTSRPMLGRVCALAPPSLTVACASTPSTPTSGAQYDRVRETSCAHCGSSTTRVQR